jgi:hypothetical protein
VWMYIRSKGYRDFVCRKNIRMREINSWRKRFVYGRYTVYSDNGQLKCGKSRKYFRASQVAFWNDNRNYIWGNVTKYSDLEVCCEYSLSGPEYYRTHSGSTK